MDLKGKTISILGDSISTYKGISNDAFSNISTLYNPYFYYPPFPLESLYWKRLIDKLGLILCVNNSWSGGNLSGKEDPASGINRSKQLSHNNGTEPNLILIYMGINDLGRGINADIFSADYEETLLNINDNHPDAMVCCINLPDRDIIPKKRTEAFNFGITKAVQNAGDHFFIADLFNSKFNNDYYYLNSLDGLHPNENGMKIMAEIIEKTLEMNLQIRT